MREAQSLGRIPETLTVAMEFITMPTLQDQLPAMEELRKQTLRCVHHQQLVQLHVVCLHVTHSMMSVVDEPKYVYAGGGGGRYVGGDLSTGVLINRYLCHVTHATKLVSHCQRIVQQE